MSIGYKETKAEQDARNYAERKASRHEVGELPQVENPELRGRIVESLEVFFVECFGDTLFTDPFGEVQLDSIRQEQAALERGSGKLNKLEPRAFGKSVRSILGACWAVLTGRQDFVIICCDSLTKSENLLRIAHMALGKNKKLLASFPELKCFHKLNGNPHAGQYQILQGEKTDISIKGDSIRFPRISRFVSSEGMITVCPFRKARGINVEGRRPSIVILDDIQSSEEATSPTSVQKNLRTLNTDIAFLGTRQNPVAIINNATVIAPHDFPSQLEAMPAFSTVRYKMVKTFPDNEELWEQYHKIRIDYDSDDPDDKTRAKREAKEFYEANRTAMDAGSSVTWDYAYSRDESDHEISTIQAAMNFIIDFGMRSFMSECQNETYAEDDSYDGKTPPEFYVGKSSSYRRGEIPEWVSKLTYAVDVGDYNLHWVLVGWSDNFRGQVIDYGVYVVGNTPDMQPKAKEIQLKSALLWFRDEVLSRNIGRVWDLCYIDAGYLATDVIYPFCRECNDQRIKPCMGSGDRAAPKDLKAFRPEMKKGIRQGFHQAERLVSKTILNWLDSEYWKRALRDLFNTESASAGSLRFFYPDLQDYGTHEAIGIHLANEWWDVDKRKWIARPRNHWGDALYYAAAGAGRLGCRVTEATATTVQTRKGRGRKVNATF